MSNGDAMKVAVIIPTYNHAHFLGAAIESVLAQTRPADEIIVIDDGSNDAPEKVTAAYPGVRIAKQANAGLSAARNRGAAEAGAPLLMFLDADDQFKPDTIALSLDSLSAHPDAAFAYGGYELVYPGNRRKRATFYPVPERAFGDFLLMNPVGMHGTVIYRREAFDEAGGFDPSLRACEDYDLYLRIAARHPIACRPEVLAEYWHHGANMSHNPPFMLRWTLQVLEARRADASAAGLVSKLEQGKRWAREYFVGTWIGQLKQGGDRGLVLKRGAQLARMAPGAMVAAAFSRISGHTRWTVKRLLGKTAGHRGG